MELSLAKSSISYYALPYHNLPCSSLMETLYDVCDILGSVFIDPLHYISFNN